MTLKDDEIVGMLEYQGRLIVATKYHVYEKLARLDFRKILTVGLTLREE